MLEKKIAKYIQAMKDLKIGRFRNEFNLLDDFNITHIALLRKQENPEKIVEEASKRVFIGKPISRIQHRYEMLKNLSLQNWNFIFDIIDKNKNSFHLVMILEKSRERKTEIKFKLAKFDEQFSLGTCVCKVPDIQELLNKNGRKMFADKLQIEYQNELKNKKNLENPLEITFYLDDRFFLPRKVEMMPNIYSGEALEYAVERLSLKYKIKMDELYDYLHKVSGDIYELENFLRNKDEEKLWNSSEDEILLKSAAKNSKRFQELNESKGDENTNRRLDYLGLTNK